MAADAKRLRLRLAANLRRLRVSAEMTQETLAERCGVERTLIQRLENGRTNCTLLTLAELCAGLPCDVSQLFIYADPPADLGRPGRPPTKRR